MATHPAAILSGIPTFAPVIDSHTQNKCTRVKICMLPNSRYIHVCVEKWGFLFPSQICDLHYYCMCPMSFSCFSITLVKSKVKTALSRVYGLKCMIYFSDASMCSSWLPKDFTIATILIIITWDFLQTFVSLWLKG